jgi:hypothetical protein
VKRHGEVSPPEGAGPVRWLLLLRERARDGFRHVARLDRVRDSQLVGAPVRFEASDGVMFDRRDRFIGPPPCSAISV